MDIKNCNCICDQYNKLLASRSQIEAETIKNLGYPPGTTKDMIIEAERKMLDAFEQGTRQECWDDLTEGWSMEELKKKWRIRWNTEI